MSRRRFEPRCSPMSRVAVVSFIALWVGAALLLSLFRPFSRSPLFDRLRPFVAPRSARERSSAGLLSVESFREVIGPLAGWIGERLSRVLGVSDDLEVRLRRIGSPLDVSAFRVRQVSIAVWPCWAGSAWGWRWDWRARWGRSCRWAWRSPLGSPDSSWSSSRSCWRRPGASGSCSRSFPWSPNRSACCWAPAFRWARRSVGLRPAPAACAPTTCARSAPHPQGLSDVDALREWADLADVAELDRLVNVLALNRQAGDLGRLISEEARSMRPRRTATRSRRSRSGARWCGSVTVATLVPGVLLMAIPFVSALQAWSAL